MALTLEGSIYCMQKLGMFIGVTASVKGKNACPVIALYSAFKMLRILTMCLNKEHTL